jgi:hypothetical protein
MSNIVNRGDDVNHQETLFWLRSKHQRSRWISARLEELYDRLKRKAITAAEVRLLVESEGLDIPHAVGESRQ